MVQLIRTQDQERDNEASKKLEKKTEGKEQLSTNSNLYQTSSPDIVRHNNFDRQLPPSLLKSLVLKGSRRRE